MGSFFILRRIKQCRYDLPIFIRKVNITGERAIPTETRLSNNVFIRAYFSQYLPIAMGV